MSVYVFYVVTPRKKKYLGTDFVTPRCLQGELHICKEKINKKKYLATDLVPPRKIKTWALTFENVCAAPASVP